MSPIAEAERAAELAAAEVKAVALFDEVTRRGLVRPGVSERTVSDEVRDLGHAMFGTNRQWHKRVVRAGPHTLFPYAENPPDRIIEADDIVFLDFGPIFDEWEADYGRTFVLGEDPVKHRIAADLEPIFEAGRAHFEATPDITGAQLYAHVCGLAEQAGWTFGGSHSGHLVGEFPHELIDGAKIMSYITEGNDEPMRRHDPSGRECHWILEVHLVDRGHGFGGFFEQLLTVRR